MDDNKMEVKDCELREVVGIDEKESVLKVAKKLKENKERHIIVTKEDRPIGIISTTDINNRLVAEGKDANETKADQIMTKNIMTCDISDPLAKVYFKMLHKDIYSCPVVENGKLKATLDAKQAMNQLIKSKAKEDGGEKSS